MHINESKCCFMHFDPKPNRNKNNIMDNDLEIEIARNSISNELLYVNGKEIKEVSKTKFLGVIIDNKLTWLPQIDDLRKRLKSATGMLTRIRHNIPRENYKSLYYTLFESHLSYCITVFGGVAKTHMDKLFRTQKHCMSILFGDLEAYLDKFKTCARTREYGKQKLGSEFFCKEHTKPLFTELDILACANIYINRTCLETLKILKYREPASLYKLYNQSSRSNLIITPIPSTQITYTGAKLLNSAIKIISKKEYPVNIKIGPFKTNLKKCLLQIQKMHGEEDWYPANFDIETATQTKIEQPGTNLFNFNN